MDRKILRKIALVMVLALMAIGGLVNVGTLVADVAIEEPGEGEAGYKWKYVANNVWHCTNGTTLNCDTPSSHSWQ